MTPPPPAPSARWTFDIETSDATNGTAASGTDRRVTAAARSCLEGIDGSIGGPPKSFSSDEQRPVLSTTLSVGEGG